MPHSIGQGGKDVLELCEMVELACAELYHHFAELFKDEREDFLLWLKTAMEEENHARLFGLVSKLRRDNIIESSPVQLVEAEATLLYVRSLIEQVKKEPPAMEEALLLAIDLEIKLDGFMIDKVIKLVDDSYEKSFLTVTNADSRHVEALQEAYERFVLPK